MLTTKNTQTTTLKEKTTMITQLQQELINNLERAIKDLDCRACMTVSGKCSVCPFHEEYETAGDYCIVGQLDTFLEQIKDNMENNNNA